MVLGQLRVGKGTIAPGILKTIFGGEVDRLHDPEYSSFLTAKAKDGEIALKTAKVSHKAILRLMEIQVEIEKIRHDVQKTALQKSTEIEKLQADIQGLCHEHGLNMQMINQELNQKMAVASASFASESDLSRQKTANIIRLIAANHQHKLGAANKDHQHSLGEWQRNAARQERIRAANQADMDYLTSAHYNPTARQLAGNTGGGLRQLGRSFMGMLRG